MPDRWADAHGERHIRFWRTIPQSRSGADHNRGTRIADRRGGVQLAAVDRLVQVDEIHLVSPSDPRLTLSGSLAGTGAVQSGSS